MKYKLTLTIVPDRQGKMCMYLEYKGSIHWMSSTLRVPLQFDPEKVWSCIIYIMENDTEWLCVGHMPYACLQKRYT